MSFTYTHKQTNCKFCKTNSGFSLLEILIVVAIIGVLASIAFPTYSGYITNTKVNAHRNNFNTAAHLIIAEAAKINAGGECDNIIATLNSGSKTAVGSTNPAFVKANTAGPGQIAIDGLNASSCVESGATITVILDTVVDGTVAADYHGSVLPLVFTYPVD